MASTKASAIYSGSAAGRVCLAPVRPCAARAPYNRIVRSNVAAKGGATASQPVAFNSARHARLACRVGHDDVNWDAFRASSEIVRPWADEHKPGCIHQYDYLVIGSGIAGLTYALKVAAYGNVAIITKETADEGCTQYAQGGVCAVLDQADSVEEHVRDTMIAGAFLNDIEAVEAVCREGPARVLELAELGAEFTRNKDGSLHLGMEGGHSKRRIVHAADMSGAEIERALLSAARAHPSISFFEHHLASDLVVEEHEGEACVMGVDVMDQRNMCTARFLGLATMLASGGCGQLYPITTNPSVATGDGIAMAYRAGAAVSNMEFVQFHPTALYTPPDDSRQPGAPPERTFLITEAVRGEGGRLYNLHGERFMAAYDARLELAPRDIVARAINHQMRTHGHDHVLLDISHVDGDAVRAHFPGVAARCASLGIDITRDPIPVAPAQHYTCGGVRTGLHGETGLRGLWACGEVACSGLHGANRLASNSLLEGLVFAERAVAPSVAYARDTRSAMEQARCHAAASFRGGQVHPLPAPLSAWAAAKRDELNQLMWGACGIVRRRAELREATRYAGRLELEARAVLANAGMSTDALELVNLATVGGLVASSALQRRESRGGHFLLDHPEEVDAQRVPSVLRAGSPWPTEGVGSGEAVDEAAGEKVGPNGRRVLLLSAMNGAAPGTSVVGGATGKQKKTSGMRELAVRALRTTGA